MLMLHALRKKSVRNLWLGQMSSAIGDEVYKVAFVWLAVTMIGSNTGYLTSLQLLAGLACGILGGKWADRWNPYHSMINIDMIRAALTLVPVVFYYFGQSSFTALVLVSIAISGLGAFFDPAIQTTLPALSQDPSILKGANGLFSITFRFARVMGPAIIGILSAIVPTIHFFSINALSFFISAFAIFTIRNHFPKHVAPSNEHEHILENFLESWRALKKNPLLYNVILSKTYTSGAWWLAYSLGLALLIHQIDPNDVTAFGMVMSSYGVGNVIAAVVVGNMERKRPGEMVFLGLVWLGACFIATAASHSLPLIMLFSALGAIGGPLNDLPCNDLIQLTTPVKDLPKIFRLRFTLENIAALVFMTAGPLLFHWFSVRTVILGCGVLISLTGIYFYFKMRSISKTASAR